MDELDARRKAGPAAGENDPGTLARRWRKAVNLLEAACRAVAVSETPETIAAQDAADAEVGETFGTLAATVGVHPALLHAHADALEWLMEEYGALSDGPHHMTLGRTIVAELRLMASDRVVEILNSGRGR